MSQSFTFTDATAAAAATSATLSAVNKMLRAIGAPPVTALDTGGTSEAAEAESMLDEQNNLVQSDGWHCNTDDEVVYTPDASDQIQFASTVISFRGTSSSIRLTMRNGYLYDLDDDTDSAFEDDITLYNVISEIAFSQLPSMLRAYIVQMACVEFQRYKVHDTAMDATLRDDLTTARVRAIQENSDLAEPNVLTTVEARRIKGDRG